MSDLPRWSGLSSASAAGIAPVVTGWTDDGTNVRLTTPTDTVSIGTSTPVAGAELTVLKDDASNAAVTDVIVVDHTTSGAAGAGIGTGLLLRAEASAGAISNVARIAGLFTTATTGAEDSAIDFSTRAGGGALTTQWRISSTGLFPSSDNTKAIGSNTARVLSLALGTSGASVYLASGDANPSSRLGTTGLSMGAGGASAVDWTLLRTGAAAATVTGALTTQARTIATSFNLEAAGVYAVAAADEFVGMDTTTGAQAVNLPAAVTGRRLIVKNTSLLAVVNACNVTPNGVETIDGVAGVLALTGTQSVTLLGRTGTGWYIV